MARGNQREKSREANLKKQAGQVRQIQYNPSSSPTPCDNEPLAWEN